MLVCEHVYSAKVRGHDSGDHLRRHHIGACGRALRCSRRAKCNPIVNMYCRAYMLLLLLLLQSQEWKTRV